MHEIIKRFELLGLNERQAEFYYYLLQKRRVLFSDVEKRYNITTMGLLKMINSMKRRGVIKTLKYKNRTVITPIDIKTLKKTVLGRVMEKRRDFEQLMVDMEAGFGNYSIRLRRLDKDLYKHEVDEFIKDSRFIFMFHDYKAMPKIPYRIEPKYWMQHFTLLYESFDEKFHHDVGKRIEIEKDQHLCNIVTAQKSVFFITSTGEGLVIDNEEIAELTQYFIKEIYDKIAVR